MAAFGSTSLGRLETCHPKVISMAYKVLEYINEFTKDHPYYGFDYTVVCGWRNEADQTSAYVARKSKVQWPNSRHNRYNRQGKPAAVAIDIAPYKDGGIPWKETDQFFFLITLWFKASQNLGIKIEWGGHFNSFFDGPHIQLHESEYN